MKPLVGITAWKRRLETYYGPDTLQTLSVNYTDAVRAAGMTPIILPAAMEDSDAKRLVATVDGLLLSGGSDVDPASYGKRPKESYDHSTVVDDFEVSLVREARAQNKPVLAICRGLQLLNVALGGTLNQEVTSEGGVHEPVTRDHVEMNARRHVVTFEDDSILAGMYGASEAKVNTLHHQGVDRLADDLIVEGTTDDGLIEAARCRGDWWALGVQWHPERLDEDHQGLFALFREQMLDN